MKIQIEILQYNYWEHFKSAKEIALILPIEHPKRTDIDAEMKKIIDKINKLKDEGKEEDTFRVL